MREVKATPLQRVESHLLRVSSVKLRDGIDIESQDARIVARIHGWVEAAADGESEASEIMADITTTAEDLDARLKVDLGS